MFAAEGDRGENVFGIARDDDSDGNLTVVRTVGRIQGAAAGVKTDLSAQMASESGFKRYGVNGLRAGSQSAG
jgi:hypothetical protein